MQKIARIMSQSSEYFYKDVIKALVGIHFGSHYFLQKLTHYLIFNNSIFKYSFFHENCQ